MPPFFAEVARVLRPGGFVVVAASQGDATPFYTSHSVMRVASQARIVEHVTGGADHGPTGWRRSRHLAAVAPQ